MAAALSATPETARAYHAECAEIAELRHDPCLRSYTAWAYAVATWRAGDPEAALSIARDALSATSSRSDQLSLTLCLEAIAWIEASRGRHATAAVLLGTADRLWARMGTSTTAFPGLFRFRRESEADSRWVLGHHAFDAIWTRRTELSLEGACACGLGDVEITPSATANADADADGQPAPVIGVAAGDRLAAAGLTRRERQVAGLVARGLTNKEIAARLVISLRTVETHVQQVLTKLGFHSRGKVASWLAGQRAGGT